MNKLIISLRPYQPRRWPQFKRRFQSVMQMVLSKEKQTAFHRRLEEKSEKLSSTFNAHDEI